MAVHPVENIRGTASEHLAGRRIVLAVSGSIAAVKCVELSRELIRHGASVHAVMSDAARGIITPEAMHFATGNPVITKLTGAVEHVALLGDVPEKADLLLVAPATANTVSKIALGIDDGPVTTCATVAVGTRTPIVVAPAMHDAMLDHPIVAEHAGVLVDRLGVTWVEPKHDEKKAKLADVDAIVDAVIHRLAQDDGPLAGKRCLVIGGATAEPVDPVRVITNRSSGKSALILAQELRRLGADVQLWYGHATEPVPSALASFTTRFATHAELMRRVEDTDGTFDQVWMPAAINDYAPEARTEKIGSEHDGLVLPMNPLPKVIEAARKRWKNAVLVAFKAESDAARLEERARERMARYKAQWVVANSAEAFGSDDTQLLLIGPDDSRPFTGAKRRVLADVARAVAEGRTVPA